MYRIFVIILLASLNITCTLAETNLSTDIGHARTLAYIGHEYLEAASLFEKCSHIAKMQNKTNTYLLCLHDASECYYMLDDYKHVYSLCKEYDNALGNANEDVKEYYTPRGHKMWGTYYYGQTSDDTSDINFRKSEERYLKACAMMDRYDESDFNEKLRMDLAQLYYKWKKYDKALLYLDSIEPSAEITAHKAMCYARKNDFSEALSLIESALRESKGKEVYYEYLRRKGKILMMCQDVDGNDNLEAARWCYEQYVNYQTATIAKRMKGMSELQREQYWLGLHDFLTDCYRLGNAAPELLYNLALFSKGYLLECNINGTKTPKTTWQQVQKALRKDEAAIEFLLYNGKDDNQRVGALVLAAGMQSPCFIDLASAKEIDNNSVLGEEDKLSAIVWNGSMQSKLKQVKKIYFAADGVIHKCPIEYLYPDSLMSCVRLSSTRLLTTKQKAINTSKILLCGGIDYNTPQQAIAENNDELSYQSLKDMYSSIDSLPGTKSEIDSIMFYRQNASDVALEGDKATDAQFRVYARQFPCIHVATHGYYVPVSHVGTDLKPLTSDESMSQSGLVFAGARHALTDSTHIEGSSDGLLSAKELSRLKLNGTDLVVLSACQSAQGEVTADGIYGLQRALKLSGVKAIIASLWDVDDRATAILMSYFYKNLKTDSDVHHAFMCARRQLMEDKYMRFLPSSLSARKVQSYNYPRYKNAFIMIDIK